MSTDFRRLYRSEKESRLAGICAGLGYYFSIDPVVVRLGWLAVTCLTGFIPGLIAYGVAWLVIPLEPVARVEYTQEPPLHQAEPVNDPPT